jgi:hypothetical protein
MLCADFAADKEQIHVYRGIANDYRKYVHDYNMIYTLKPPNNVTHWGQGCCPLRRGCMVNNHGVLAFYYASQILQFL